MPLASPAHDGDPRLVYGALAASVTAIAVVSVFGMLPPAMNPPPEGRVPDGKPPR
jgi:hypothetical protein